MDVLKKQSEMAKKYGHNFLLIHRQNQASTSTQHCIGTENIAQTTQECPLKNNIRAFQKFKETKAGRKKGTKFQVPFASWLPIKGATKAVTNPNELLLLFSHREVGLESEVL